MSPVVAFTSGSHFEKFRPGTVSENFNRVELFFAEFQIDSAFFNQQLFNFWVLLVRVNRWKLKPSNFNSLLIFITRPQDQVSIVRNDSLNWISSNSTHESQYLKSQNHSILYLKIGGLKIQINILIYSLVLRLKAPRWDWVKK